MPAVKYYPQPIDLSPLRPIPLSEHYDQRLNAKPLKPKRIYICNDSMVQTLRFRAELRSELRSLP